MSASRRAGATGASDATDASEAVAALRAAGVGRGSPVSVVAVPGVGVALAFGDGGWSGAREPAAVLAEAEAAVGPRWVWWSAHGFGAPPGIEAAGAGAPRPGLPLCWDLAAVHRVLWGGHRDDPAAVWAGARGLPVPPPPRRRRTDGQLDLLAFVDEDPDGGRAGDADEPLGPDGQLRPGWVEETLRGAAAGGVELRLARAGRFARLALEVMAAQERALRALPDPRARPTRLPLAVLTARAESAAELLARELWRDGLPVHRPTAEATIAALAGPRPRDGAGEAAARRARDAPVLRHLGESVDLRNPASVRAGLRAVGIDLPDTRQGRLTALRGTHPVIEPLLAWRKAERIATTYGYRWLDSHVGADGRLRGQWRGSDGAAGRMTAAAGLHNLPADLRVAVAAEPGHRLVRADLGQIEPRVLAVVSGDPELVAATRQDDLYAPVAARLGVDRPTAKIAVLAAMYGQTTGAAGQALRQMRATYPVALAYLDAADAAGRAAALGQAPGAAAPSERGPGLPGAGPSLRTFGGRRVPLRALAADEEADLGRASAAWGRFARNAVVQGAAAELFKAWAVTVRQELVPLGGVIVLCLHDELLLHVPAEHAEQAARATRSALAATARHWAAGSRARFVVDIAIVRRWSDAKA
ncbi:DNA polymerase [Frankia nepalensis]|uniref:DNA polymerase n=1 Tax=Frankia nepalensis TaxID=1836974 RepID=UPI001D8A6A72|nr:DNA polymerase I [Frankia nepalensis]MBL7512047.1 DNA polymerase I [Frankia nepalensis]